MKNTISFIVGITIFVGLLHFITGPDYPGPFKDFVNGYLIDILLPFTLYLLMGLTNKPMINNIFFRGLFVFAIGVVVEILQYHNIPIFGRTYDVWDLVAYAFGVLLAIAFEHYILSRFKT